MAVPDSDYVIAGVAAIFFLITTLILLFCLQSIQNLDVYPSDVSTVTEMCDEGGYKYFEPAINGKIDVFCENGKKFTFIVPEKK